MIFLFPFGGICFFFPGGYKCLVMETLISDIYFHLDGTSTCRWYINRVRESSRYSPVPKPTCLKISEGSELTKDQQKWGGVYHSIGFPTFKKNHGYRRKGDDFRRPFGGIWGFLERSVPLVDERFFRRWTSGMQTFYAQNGGILQIRLMRAV